MIGCDDPWIAACGAEFTNIVSYTIHEKDCRACDRLKRYAFDDSVLEPENDADDRGICYEED